MSRQTHRFMLYDMRNEVKLGQRVDSDHIALMAELDQFNDMTIDRNQFSKLKRFFDRLNACHYAEEQALYLPLEQTGLVDSGYFKAYHMMLENLCESIKLNGHLSDSLPLELDVLRVLINMHFNDEKKQVLPIVETHYDTNINIELGRLYVRAAREIQA